MDKMRFSQEKENELYDDFNTYDPNFDLENIATDSTYQEALQKNKDKRPPPTASMNRLKTGFVVGAVKNMLVVPPSSMGLRPFTGKTDSPGNRPMTAVKAAGYSSKMGTAFDPLNQSSKGISPSLEPLSTDSPEDKVKQLEKTVNELIDESCLANSRGEMQLALEKAKEAERKERVLMDVKKRNNPRAENVNLDLTYLVKFNLANQQAANNMDQEAINTFQSLVKSKTYSHSGRLKVNIGNIYLKVHEYEKAIKFFKMALDQIPGAHKSMNSKIKRNVCVAYVKLARYEEAATILELMLEDDEQQPNVVSLSSTNSNSNGGSFPSNLLSTTLNSNKNLGTAFQLLLCHHALSDREMMKRTFERMLAVSRRINAGTTTTTDEDKYISNGDDKQYNSILEVIRNDALRQIERDRAEESERYITMAAKVIAPSIDSNYEKGYDWCIDQVRSSPQYVGLAHNLDIDKAIGFLKQKDFQQAVDILKSFEKKDTKVAVVAATNLSFLYNLEGNEALADKYSEIALEADRYNPSALVNKGNVYYKRGDTEKSRECYSEALQNDSSCIEALYNSGLANKKLRLYEEALDAFHKLHSIFRSNAQVMYQLADIYALKEEIDQAKEWLMHVNSVVPSDATVLQKLGGIFESQGDTIQSLHYYSEAYKFDPTNISVLEWLGVYFVESQVPENAIQYFERGAFLQPGQVKWHLRVASCYRRAGNYQQALELYKLVHRRFPDNIECLKILTKFCIDMNLDEGKKFAEKLKEAEKAQQIREERALSGTLRGGVRRRIETNDGEGGRVLSSSLRSHEGSNNDHQSSTKSSLKSPDSNNSYADPLGPQIERPRTAATRRKGNLQPNTEDFDDEEIGDDLLPD